MDGRMKGGARSFVNCLRVGFGILVVAGLVGCSTTGKFIVPEGTDLVVYERPVEVSANGTASMRPFAFNAAGTPPDGGIPYRLMKDGQVVQEGRLRTVFRGASIFWPPFAVFYWPMGLNPHITYDLVNGTQE